MNEINDFSKTITNDMFYKLTDDLRNDYRLSFTNIIIDFKHKTHLCQIKCYETKDRNLLKIEDCADNCYTPLFNANENITKLITISNNSLENCRAQALISNQESIGRNHLLKQCLIKYKKDLEKQKDEINYIYNGYLNKLNGMV